MDANPEEKPDYEWYPPDSDQLRAQFPELIGKYVHVYNVEKIYLEGHLDDGGREYVAMSLTFCQEPDEGPSVVCALSYPQAQAFQQMLQEFLDWKARGSP